MVKRVLNVAQLALGGPSMENAAIPDCITPGPCDVLIHFVGKCILVSSFSPLSNLVKSVCSQNPGPSVLVHHLPHKRGDLFAAETTCIAAG